MVLPNCPPQKGEEWTGDKKREQIMLYLLSTQISFPNFFHYIPLSFPPTPSISLFRNIASAANACHTLRHFFPKFFPWRKKGVQKKRREGGFHSEIGCISIRYVICRNTFFAAVVMKKRKNDLCLAVFSLLLSAYLFIFFIPSHG